MSASPRVLVLLAARNGANVLERQLRSVLAQTGVDVQVELRDDGSTDGTRELVKTWALRDVRIRLRPDHDASGSASSNFFRLIADARLDGITHVAFCDQDDEWHVDKLQRATACLRESGAGGYSGAVEALWPDGRQRTLAQEARVRRADHLFEGAGQGCTFVFTTELFRRLQADLATHAALTSDLHYHDWALYALARGAEEPWCFDQRPSMIYHQHSGNDTGARNSASGVIRRIALIRQGWYRLQVDAIVRLLRAARPTHQPAQEWERLANSASARRERLHYVLKNGRRRAADRVIQAVAVALGYL